MSPDKKSTVAPDSTLAWQVHPKGHYAFWANEQGSPLLKRTRHTGEVSSLSLVRADPGSPPIYYREQGGTLCFDHDLARLTASDTAGHSLHVDSAINYLWRGRARMGYCLMDGVQTIPAQHELFWDFVSPPVLRRTHWPVWRRPLPKKERSKLAGVLHGLQAALRQEVMADGVTADGVALFLSGGVDSSLLAALACEQGLSPTAYTVEFTESYGENETQYARQVARQLGLVHHVVPVSVAQASLHLQHLLDSKIPHAAPAAISNRALQMATAAQGETRVLSALGADECFGGYHKTLAYSAKQTQYLLRHGMDAPAFFASTQSYAQMRTRPVFFGIAEFIPQASLKKQLARGLDLRTLMADDIQFYSALLKEKPQAHLLEAMAHHEYQHRIADLLLPSFDALPAAAHAPRYPFLNPALFAYASALPLDDCYWHEGGYWWAKRLLRQLARRYLPEDIVMRKRQVFLAPIAHWLRNKGFRGVVRGEIAQSRLWEMGWVQVGVKQDLLARLDHDIAAFGDPAQVEYLWAYLTLCAWVHRYVTR